MQSQFPDRSRLSSLSGCPILVTGASGFIGTRVVAKLAGDHDADVIALARNSSDVSEIESAGARVVRADLRDRDAVFSALEGIRVVIHLAYDFRRSQKSNLRGFTHLVDASSETGVECFVQTSSIAVYDDWYSADTTEASPCYRSGFQYKNTKTEMEKELDRRYVGGVLPSIIVQPTIVYGPNSLFWVDSVVEKLLSGTVVLPDEGRGLCNVVYVDDLADALILAAGCRDHFGERFIVSGPQAGTWRDLYEAYQSSLGVNSLEYIEYDQLAITDNGTEEKRNHRAAPTIQLLRTHVSRAMRNLAQHIVGDKSVAKLRALALNLRKKRGPLIYYPDPDELALYRSTGNCVIDKARQQLGYNPHVDFAEGMRLTGIYISDKYRENK